MAALAGYLLLGVLATWPLVLHALVAVPGFDSPITRAGMADQDQGLWAAWWVRHALFDLHTSPTQTDLLYWPAYRPGLSLLLYDMQWLRTGIALPVQALFGLAAGYNLGVFASFMLGGYGTFLLARDRGLSRPAAALAGLIFVAGPYHLMQLFWETSLVIVQALPFALLWSWRALQAGGRRAILLAAACLVWANLSSWYYGLYAVVALAALAAGLAWRRRHAGWPGIRPVGGRFLLVAALYGLGYSPILLPVLAQVLQAPHDSGLFVNIATIRGASLQWYKLFLNDRDPVVSPAQWHGTGFLGYTAVALAAWGALRGWRRALPWLVLFAVFLNLAMGPDLHAFGTLVTFPNGDPVPLPYAFLLRLPGMSLIRAPAHAGVMLLLCTALLTGLGLDRLGGDGVALNPSAFVGKGGQGVRTAGLALLAAGLALAEYLTIPIPLYPVTWDPVFAQIGQEAGTFGIFELPVTLHASNDHHRMFNQIAHGKAIAGGYLPRPVPDPYRQPDSPFARFTEPYTPTDVLAQDEDAATRALLRLTDFRYLAIYHGPKDYRVGDSPWVWPWPAAPLNPADPDVTVYPVPPVPLDRPYLYLGASWSLPERAAGPAGPIRRWLGADPGYLIVWSPGGTGRMQLDLAATADAGPRAVALALEAQPLLTAVLPPDGTPRRVTTPPLVLATGWYRVRVADLAPPPAPGTPPAVALYRVAWTPGP